VAGSTALRRPGRSNVTTVTGPHSALARLAGSTSCAQHGGIVDAGPDPGRPASPGAGRLSY